MKNINKIKKVNIIVILIFLISLIFSNHSQASIGEIFSDADSFLDKRRINKYYYK